MIGSDILGNRRPFILGCMPPSLRLGVAMRWFRKKDKYKYLYKNSGLYLNPAIKMDLLPGDVVSDSIALTGMYEHEKAKRLVQIARDGKTLVDVGANLGFFSLLWASVDQKNKVVAFEASPRNIHFLRKNIATNSLGNQISLFPKAVGLERGVLEFDIGNEEQTGWGGFTNSRNDRTISVEVVSLDEMLQTYPIVHLLKIDIEGADFWALKGCEKLLQEKRILEIWFEENKPRAKALGIKENACQNFLVNLGYKVIPEGNPKAETVDWRAVRVR